MLNLPQIAIRHPRKTILLATALTLAMAPGMLRLTLRTDGHALVPASAPEVIADARIRAEFGLDDPIAVVLCSPGADGIFNPHTVRLIHRLTGEFQDLAGVRPERVFSLATETSDRVFPGTLRFRKLLEPMPESDEELAAMLPVLRSDLNAIQLYNGTFVSKDSRCAAILVGAPAGEDRLSLLAEIQQRITALGDIPERVELVGAPVAEALLGTHILEDLGVPTQLLGFRTFEPHSGAVNAGDGSAGTVTPSGERSRLDTRPLLHRVGEVVSRDIGLVPVALAVMALVFLLCFRSPVAAGLPLIEVGASLVFVFGLMGLLGVPIYLTTAVLPIILTATGITDEIHVFSRYRQLLRERPGDDHVEIVRATMREMTRPIVMTSVTTGVGFLSFAFSSIGPVQAFGIFTGVGSLFCMLWSISVVPAMFVLLSPRHFVSGKTRLQGPRGRSSRAFQSIGHLAVRFRWGVLALTVAAIAVLPGGVKRVIVQDSWIDGFAEGSAFRESLEHFNEQFLGMHTLLLHVDAGHGREFGGLISAADIDGQTVRIARAALPGTETVNGWRIRLERSPPPQAVDDQATRPAQTTFTSWVSAVESTDSEWQLKLIGGRPLPAHVLRIAPGDMVRYELRPAPLMQPVVLHRLAELQRFIAERRSEAVGGVLGPSDYLSTVHFMRHARGPDRRRIPDDVQRVELFWNDYATIYGPARLRQLVDETYSRGVITVLLKDANFVDTARLMAAIQSYAAERLSPHGIRLTFAGDVAVSQSLIAAIVRTETQSLLGTLLGVLLVTVILGRSLWFGLLCIIPSGLAVLGNFALMGWAGIPLGVATSMFSAMTIGIGVDFAIHLQWRYRRLLSSEGNEATERESCERHEPDGREVVDARSGGAASRRVRALVAAVGETGPAIMVDTLAVCLGFGILIFSQVPANSRLGALVAFSIVICFVVTVILLPALLGAGGDCRRMAASKS